MYYQVRSKRLMTFDKCISSLHSCSTSLAKDFLEGLHNVEVVLANCDLNYADDLGVFMYAEHVRRRLQRLARNAAPFAMCCAQPKCKVTVQSRTTTVPNLILHGEELTTVNRFCYFCSCVTKDDNTAAKLGTRIRKAAVAS